MRDHSPITIEEFNGLWKRGDADSCPPDHFPAANNLQFIQGGFRTRDGIDPYLPYANIVRTYTFTQESGQSILSLDAAGNIFDSGSPTPFVPILSIPGMLDFDFVSIAGRAYLTPSDGEKGLENEFVYVYQGDGSSARKAAGSGPSGSLSLANSATAGNVEAGYHVFAAVYETDTGFLTNINTPIAILAPGGKKVDISSIPVSPDSFVTKVHIVATKAISATFYDGNVNGYEFFFIPGAEVVNGVTTLAVSFFDSELLDSADDLQDLFTEIPAGVGVNTYHGRLLVWATFTDISLVLVSNVGEPEAINQISGLLIFPLDGKPITRAQEFRDILYVFKQTRTNAWTDNGDDPSAWPMTVLDQGIGSCQHGVAAVLDSGGVNVDYLVICDYAGVMLFNGSYVRPEFSFKIRDFWLALERDDFGRIQVLNDVIQQFLYIVLPDGSILFADYSNGLDPEKVRWCPWTIDVEVTSVTLINTSTLVIGGRRALVTI